MRHCVTEAHLLVEMPLRPIITPSRVATHREPLAPQEPISACATWEHGVVGRVFDVRDGHFGNRHVLCPHLRRHLKWHVIDELRDVLE